jgi:hypothetical protein
MSVPVCVPFLLHIVPFCGTKGGGQGSRAHKGNGTFVPSRFPSRFGPVVSRFVSRWWC